MQVMAATKNDSRKIIVLRDKPRIPPGLREYASRAGMPHDPAGALRRVIAKHDRLIDAAAEIGVTTLTLRDWRYRLGIVEVRTPKRLEEVQ